MAPSPQPARRVTRRALGDYLRAQLALALALLNVHFRGRGNLLDYSSTEVASDADPAQLRRAAELEVALRRATRFGPFRPRCLARSVALQALLQSAGIRGSRIRIGVRPDPEGLTAHAWVTLADGVVGDDPRFVGRFREIADATMAGLR